MKREMLDPDPVVLAKLPDDEWWNVIRRYPGLFPNWIRTIHHLQWDLLQEDAGLGQEFNALYCLRLAVARFRRPRLKLNETQTAG